MSIESIIGIVAGIFGIVTGCAWLHGVTDVTGTGQRHQE